MYSTLQFQSHPPARSRSPPPRLPTSTHGAAFPHGQPRASPCLERPRAPSPRGGGSTCYVKRLLVKSPLARNVGRERRAACSGSVYYVLTALSMVKVNDIIPLCTVMKQLGEGSISARRVTRLRYRGWRARPAQPPRPAHGRGKAAEGSKGSNNQQGHSLLKGPRPHTWEGQWPCSAVSHLGPQHPMGF